MSDKTIITAPRGPWLIKHNSREAWRSPWGWVEHQGDAMVFRTEEDAQAMIESRSIGGHTVQKAPGPDARAIAGGHALTEYNPWGTQT